MLNSKYIKYSSAKNVCMFLLLDNYYLYIFRLFYCYYQSTLRMRIIMLRRKGHEPR